MNIKTKLNECTGFKWDEGNIDKNFILHNVTALECEEIFFNQPIVVKRDDKHSQKEQRFYSLGQTDFGRLLFIAFTIRDSLIRIISARDMTKKEERIYFEQAKNTKI